MNRQDTASRWGWLVCSAVLAGGAVWLRRWQIDTAFEGDLNLPVAGAPATICLLCLMAIAAALLGILAMVQREAPLPRHLHRQGRRDLTQATGSGLHLALTLVAAALLLAAAPMLLQEGAGLWQAFRLSADKTGNNGILVILTGLSSVLAFVGVLVAGVAVFRGKQGGRSSMVMAAVNGCAWMMESYRGHAANPVQWDYVPLLLAVVLGMLLYLEWAALSVGKPRPRLLLWLAGMTIVFSAMAAAAHTTLSGNLMLAAQSVCAVAVLWYVPVNLANPPQQEEPEELEEQPEELEEHTEQPEQPAAQEPVEEMEPEADLQATKRWER